MKLKYLFLAVLLSTSAAVASIHYWQMQSWQIVNNRFNTPVKQCTWQCSSVEHGNHTTTTVGMSESFCPRPQ